MSKFLELYKNLKSQDSETIYLFQSGIFFIALDEDAKFLSKKFNFKLTNFNSNCLKCGFPSSSFSKYYLLFQNSNIKIKVIENNTIYCLKEYSESKLLDNLISKINKIDINNLSVSEAYQFIEDLKSCVENHQI